MARRERKTYRIAGVGGGRSLAHVRTDVALALAPRVQLIGLHQAKVESLRERVGGRVLSHSRGCEGREEHDGGVHDE
jgi:hypothetical protein